MCYLLTQSQESTEYLRATQIFIQIKKTRNKTQDGKENSAENKSHWHYGCYGKKVRLEINVYKKINTEEVRSKNNECLTNNKWIRLTFSAPEVSLIESSR